MPKKLSPILPGEILLEEFLIPMGINQSQLAKALDVKENRISQIINGKRAITADTALRLGKFFNMEPEFWLHLQTRYDLKVASESTWEDIKKKVQDVKTLVKGIYHPKVTKKTKGQKYKMAH